MLKDPEKRREYQREHYKKNQKRWLELVVERGSACEKCGHSEHIEILQFHHRNPKEKSFNVGRSWTRSWESVKEEIEKCDLVCPNCHAVEHKIRKI